MQLKLNDAKTHWFLLFREKKKGSVSGVDAWKTEPLYACWETELK